MSLLCIDIGNSNIACGLYDDGEWKATWRVRTDNKRTSDEYSVLFHGFFTQKNISPLSVRGICVSSVVPELIETFRLMGRDLFGVTPLFISTELVSEVSVAIDNPRELGPDLYANGVAGYAWARSSVIVVDFGTALSFTCVEKIDEEVKLRGASIAPGLRTAVYALSLNTAQLPHVELVPPPKGIGTNTIQAIQSGIVFGYSALVTGMVQRLRAELNEPVKCIATGGLSTVLQDHVMGFDHVDPLLTLEGLRILFEHHGGKIQ
ncbi:MAG: type III pantothenate kinase [Spirochaetales bacterium]|nr:type III pantothenate kinase [Spirochaetales bacterium]